VAHLDSAPAAEFSPTLAKKGILFGSLDALVAEHGDLLRPFFERRVVDPFKDKFSALHAAFWCGGTLLYVPKRVAMEQPLHSLSALSAGGVDLGKTLVILEEGAEATLLSETASATAGGGGLHCGSIELIVEKAARLRSAMDDRRAGRKACQSESARCHDRPGRRGASQRRNVH
jgi:Fe-S cluster assembly protein SufD